MAKNRPTYRLAQTLFGHFLLHNLKMEDGRWVATYVRLNKEHGYPLIDSLSLQPHTGTFLYTRRKKLNASIYVGFPASPQASTYCKRV